MTEIITKEPFEEGVCDEFYFKQDDLSPKFKISIEIVADWYDRPVE